MSEKLNISVFLVLIITALCTVWNTFVWMTIPIRIQEQQVFQSGQLDSLQNIPADNLSAERLDFVIEELKSYRSFVEAERKAHMEFITRIYGLGGALAAVLIAFLGYFGFKSLDDVEKKANSTFREKLDEVLSKKLTEQKGFADILAEVIRREGLWKGTNILFVGDFEDEHRKDIESFFKDKVRTDFKTRKEFEAGQIDGYAVVVFDYQTDSKEKQKKKQPDGSVKDEEVPIDSFLRQKVGDFAGKSIPLIVFTKGGWIEGETKKVLDQYPYFTPSNNRISLFANIFDAFQLASTRNSN